MEQNFVVSRRVYFPAAVEGYTSETHTHRLYLCMHIHVWRIDGSPRAPMRIERKGMEGRTGGAHFARYPAAEPIQEQTGDPLKYVETPTV